ncbi:MAG: helix-turn-helix domain-containing protein [Bacillus sp. (in: firmicutes)]
MTLERHSEEFGNRLKILRKKFDMTQQDLALKVGIPKSTLAGYESGVRRPRFETMEKLAEELNTSADYLIGITDNPDPIKSSKDLKKILKSGVHIDGKVLNDEDIDFAIKFLEKLAANSAKKEETNEIEKEY